MSLHIPEEISLGLICVRLWVSCNWGGSADPASFCLNPSHVFLMRCCLPSARELEKQRESTASDILQKKQEAEAAVSVSCSLVPLVKGNSFHSGQFTFGHSV